MMGFIPLVRPWIPYALGAVAAVVVLLLVRGWTTARRDRLRAEERRRREAQRGSSTRDVQWHDVVARPPAERESTRDDRLPRVVLRPAPAASTLELEQQIESIQTGLVARVDKLEARIESIERQMEPGAPFDSVRRDTAPPPASGADAWDREFRGSGDAVIGHAIGGAPREASGGAGSDAGGPRVGVEIRGSEVVASHSIPPEAWLTADGGGTAKVVLNAEVPHNAFALDRFALFFELGDRREGTYVTQTAAEVKWDGARGTLRSPGKAVAR